MPKTRSAASRAGSAPAGTNTEADEDPTQQPLKRRRTTNALHDTPQTPPPQRVFVTETKELAFTVPDFVPSPQLGIITTAPGSYPAVLRTEACLQKAVEHLLRVEPALAPVVAAHGLPLRLMAKTDVPSFQMLARSVVYQQLSGKVAAIIWGRVLQIASASGGAAGASTSSPSPFPSPSTAPANPITPAPIDRSGAIVEVPATAGAGAAAPGASCRSSSNAPFGAPLSVLTPHALLAVDGGALRACGLSERKVSYLQGIARAFTANASTWREEVLSAADEGELMRQLTQLKGVGPWTVHMLLMFHLGRPDVLPVDDLAVRKGMRYFFHLSSLPSPAEMQRLAAKWAPFRSVGAYYMWQVPLVNEKPRGDKRGSKGSASVVELPA